MPFDALVIGAGLTGATISRQLAEAGKKVLVIDRRDHLGGNMYDYVDNHGFLVHKYGPHAFHTNNKLVYDYICRYSRWLDYKLVCGAMWDGVYSPTPFNFTTIDSFYPPDEGSRLKEKLLQAFAGRNSAPVTEVINHEDPDIKAYARFLFVKDYAPYTAKQWGISPNDIDISVLRRVPLRFSYQYGYYEDRFQCIPADSYATFFNNLLNHENIHINLGVNALDKIRIKGKSLFYEGKAVSFPVVYTGALDELFDCKYGELPYRTLRFEWCYSEKQSLQAAPVVAYPEAGYTRITEYKKLPIQSGRGTSYAVEYSLAYERNKNLEPYYPVPTDQNHKLHFVYRSLANNVENLVYCGRLADFKYYYMDQALERALMVSNDILSKFF